MNPKFKKAIAGIVGAGLLASSPIAVKELNKPDIQVQRFWNVDTILNENGSKTATFHQKWVNYLDIDGWQPINTEFREEDDYFVMDEAQFKVFVPKSSKEIAVFYSDNRWDNVDDELITEAPMWMGIEAMGVLDVPCEIEDGDLGYGETNYVICKGAYPSLNADLIYYVYNGERTRLEKLVRFNSNPGIDSNLKFKLYFEDEPYVEMEGEEWDGEKVETDESISLEPYSESEDRGIGLYDFTIWDSGKDELKKTAPVNVTFQQKSDHHSLIKHIDHTFFEGAVFPVFTDMSMDFYPQTGTETSSVDGEANHLSNNSTFATIRGGAGTAGDDTGVSLKVGIANGTNVNTYKNIWRDIYLFDISSLPTTTTINSATFSWYITTYTNELTAAPGINVYSSAPASNTAVVAGDYDSLGTTAYSTTILFSAATTSAYNNFVFNATGIAAVETADNGDGIVKLGVRESVYDAANSAWDASAGNGDNDNLQGHSAESANDPTLSITYTNVRSGKKIMILQ